MDNQKWGITDATKPTGNGASWGARYILSNGALDLPPDRRGWHGEKRDRGLKGWSGKALKALSVWAKTANPGGSEVFAMDDPHGFHLRACCNGSHGYVYCTMWADREEKGPTLEQLEDMCRRRITTTDNPGWCLACGKEVEGFEPDARNCECELCGERRVFGSDELAMMGYGT